MLKDFLNFFAIFKQGASSGVASGGSDFWKMTSLENIEGFKVKAVDTNGAGDIFAGSVLHKICEGHDLTSSAKFGCFAASKKVEKFGPRLSQEEYKTIYEDFS